MEAFAVNSADLLDKSENPNLSLSVKDIMNNPKIRKTPIAPPIPKVTVRNMTGSSERDVVNQFEITTPEARYFQSYRSIIIACWFEGETYLDKNYWDYSTTTGRYRNIFLGETKRETEAKIKSGEYRLVDLN